MQWVLEVAIFPSVSVADIALFHPSSETSLLTVPETCVLAEPLLTCSWWFCCAINSQLSNLCYAYCVLGSCLKYVYELEHWCNGQKPPCCHSGHEWRHEWQHGSFCPFRRSFGCVLLLNQIFRKQCTVRQYTTLIYLINLLWKLVLGLGLDSELHYFSIFTENKKNEHLIFCQCHGR